MTSRYRVLVLTDHSKHSDQNSIYAILRQMIGHPSCISIHVASRGLEINRGFFSAMQPHSLFCQRVTEDYRWSENGDYYQGDLRKMSPDQFDIVFLRLPRPISDEFLMWLETIYQKCVIINRPSGIIKTSSKKYLLNFPEACPDIRYVRSPEEVISYTREHPIVLKPLREYGGKGIVKIIDNQVDTGDRIIPLSTYLESIIDILTTEGYLAMRYLKQVSQGDKRIIVVGDNILAASLRLPAEGSWLCNVAQGGTSVSAEVSPEEKVIIDKISPALRAAGVLIFGADTLMGDDGKRVLSEINTLSIGGFPQAEAQTGRPIIQQMIQELFNYADVQ